MSARASKWWFPNRSLPNWQWWPMAQPCPVIVVIARRGSGTYCGIQQEMCGELGLFPQAMGLQQYRWTDGGR
jgi:hypothetical protein